MATPFRPWLSEPSAAAISRLVVFTEIYRDLPGFTRSGALCGVFSSGRATATIHNKWRMTMDTVCPDVKSDRSGFSSEQRSEPEREAIDGNLRREIEALIPRLRRYARALTHNVETADGLVQDCLSRALGKIHLWEKGTDLRAWLFTILHQSACQPRSPGGARARQHRIAEMPYAAETRAGSGYPSGASRPGTSHRQTPGGATVGDPAGGIGGNAIRGSRLGGKPARRDYPLASGARSRNPAHSHRIIP
jgi:hypothetical protein